MKAYLRKQEKIASNLTLQLKKLQEHTKPEDSRRKEVNSVQLLSHV